MGLVLRKIGWRHAFTPLIALSLLFCSGPLSAGHAKEGLSLIRPERTHAKTISDKIRMVKLFTVNEGRDQHLIIGREDLQKQHSFQVNGHVTGVLILSETEMEMSVDGQPMSKIERNGDGTYSIRYFGKVKPDEIEFQAFTYYKESQRRFPTGYSYFPKVIGDSVSSRDNVVISLRSEEDSLEFSVQQATYCTLRRIQPGAGNKERAIEFQYLGRKLETHMRQEDFESRLLAVVEGIRAVEKVFKVDLVDRVNLLDYDKVQNAVTCEEKNDIWFYTRTFLEEPIEELKIISQHEALHILVDRRGFARDSSLRRHFADLKGFDPLSRERFVLITRGFTSPNHGAGAADYREFFAFIDERNFLQGMKGGHSSRNMDEFCASFLHSLMFIDRLTDNLGRPLKLESEGGTVTLLNADEREKILTTYIRTIEAFVNHNKNAEAPTRFFLETCLKKVKGRLRSPEITAG